jgi:hypothetical protein
MARVRSGEAQKLTRIASYPLRESGSGPSRHFAAGETQVAFSMATTGFKLTTEPLRKLWRR